MSDDLPGRVEAELHANPSLGPDQLAQMLGASEDGIAKAIEELLAGGRLERQGDRLVPVAGSHPKPSVFVASERADAEPLEVDDEDEPPRLPGR
jgi:hypothetical protein